MTIGETIKALREETANINQTEMGKRIKRSQLQISRMETERAHMQDDDIIAYCNYFNISADYILGLIDYPRPLKKQ